MDDQTMTAAERALSLRKGARLSRSEAEVRGSAWGGYGHAMDVARDLDSEADKLERAPKATD